MSQDADGDTDMSNGVTSAKGGIAMGTDAQMDSAIYGDSNKTEYVQSIDPNADNDDQMDELEQSFHSNKAKRIEGNPSQFAIDDGGDFDPMSTKDRQVQHRMNTYQKQVFHQTYTPARTDAFSTPSINESGAANTDYQKKVAQATRNSAQTRFDSEAKSQARGYKSIMAEREAARERKTESNQNDDKTKEGTTQNGDTQPKADGSKTQRWDAQNWDATPAPKTSRWDATPAVNTSAATPSANQWSTTPAVVAAVPTPGYHGWGATPGAMTPGAMTPGGRTPGARTPGPFGSRTPGLGYGQETPAPGSRTPGGFTPRRWDATPGVGGTTPAWGVTPGMTPGRNASRWDATPEARGGRTPMPGGMTPVHNALRTPMATPATTNVMGMATPSTPEATLRLRLRLEIDQRNQAWTEEDLDKVFEGIKGYEIVDPPPSYVPKASLFRVTATPTPMTEAPYIMPSTPAAQEMQDYTPSDPTLPQVKPDDYGYFQEIIEKKDEDVEDPVEMKRRTILKLVLKVKNGTPPQRKSALRQLSDKALFFGAGPLFDTILPLLMSPTLEDQERHLLVKIIDRILYKLDDAVGPYVHKILVVIEPLLIDEDYYARVEGREIIANLSKAAGLARMISTMRPDIDNVDEYVRNTTARAFSVVASALGIPVLIPFLKAVCQSKKSWEARHTGIKIIQQISILMGCAVLPHLRQLVDIIERGLHDQQSKVHTITALALAALAEAAAPYGDEAFDSVLRPLLTGINAHRGKTKAAFLKAVGYIIPLMDADHAAYYTRQVMPKLKDEFSSPDEEMKKIVLKVIKQCVSTEGVEASYIINEVLLSFFKEFWNRRMALDRRNYRQLVETTVEVAQKVGGGQIISRIVQDLTDENETYRKMVMETIDKVISVMGVSDIDQKLEEALVDGIVFAFQEQTAEDSHVTLSGFACVMNALGIRCKPYLPQICGIIKHRLQNPNPRVRQQAADLTAGIATVIKKCNEMGLIKHLGQILFEFLGEEYPDVLGSILGGLKAVVNVVGMEEMTPPIKDIILRLTPIMKNRHEKVQENCIDLVGRIADRGSESVSPKEWIRIAYELLDMLKAHKKGIRRAAVNTFGYIAKAVGPQDVIEILLNNLRVQERQNRVCTTVAIAIVAENCGPFTILPALMNEYRVPELNVQNGVLKSLSFLFEYIGENGRDYCYAVSPLLEDALMDRDLVHRQTACAVVKHMTLGVIGMGCEDILLHLLNYVWPNVFETTPHLVQAFTEAIDGLRMALGPGIFLQYLLQGLFHPARRVRNVYWRLYNNIYIGHQDSLVAYYPIVDRKFDALQTQDYRRQELFYFV